MYWNCSCHRTVCRDSWSSAATDDDSGPLGCLIGCRTFEPNHDANVLMTASCRAVVDTATVR